MSAEFEAFIGLEVHCQLATESKIFCSCPTMSGRGISVSALPVNALVCEVCSGQPGALPTLNSQAVRFAIRSGLALGSEIQQSSIFSRKNYFYPDLPKGYQISQNETAICLGGFVEIEREDGSMKKVALRRIHLEEDAGKSVHEFGVTLVNLNRSGVPLVEIVGEPELRTPEEAGNYLRELHAIVTAIGVTDGNMQEGNFRCDANVSVRPKGSSVLGTRVEIKNVNSFRFVEKAIAFEIQRQIAVLASGKAVIQETRLYDSQRDHTVSMRIKEEAEDYRYFPDPDLLPLKFPVAWVQEERDRLPELPAQKRSRYQTDFGLSRADSRQMSASQAISEIFEATVSLLKGLPGGAKWVANLLSGEVSRLLQESELSLTQSPLKAQHLADLGALALSGELSSTATKKILHEVWRTGESVGALVERLGLRQQNDASELEPLVETILKEQPQATEELRSGKLKVLGFLVGMVMKRSAGRGNPELIRSLIERTLDLKKDA